MTTAFEPLPSQPSNGSLHESSSKLSRISSHSSFPTPNGYLDEETTVTGSRTLVKSKRKSNEDLQLLALSTQMTEVSYSISDIQTRVFEIQELRHQADSSSASTPGVMGVTTLDQALMNLEERLESITKSVAAVDEALQSYVKPTDSSTHLQTMALDAVLRKHAALKEEWDIVQKEADTLRSELREDKWLAVFRSVGEQSDTMMNSLEKALANCQAFIWQVHHRGLDDSHSQSSGASDKPLNLDVFQSLLSSYESKKKYYVPSISKVLGILDRTVRDRITKNGECLRTHAEARARWKNVQDRIARIDVEMENVRLLLVNKDREPEPSEAGSTISRLTSRTSKSNNYLSTPSTSRGRNGSSSASIALQRSISPLRRFASRVSASIKGSGRNTPISSAATSPSQTHAPIPSPPKVPIKSPNRPQGKRLGDEPPMLSIDTTPGKKRESYFPFLSKDPSPMPSPRRSVSRGPPPVATSLDIPRPASRLSTSNDHTGTLRPRWNASPKVVELPPPTLPKPSPRRGSVSNGSFSRPITPSNRPGTSQSHHHTPMASKTTPPHATASYRTEVHSPVSTSSTVSRSKTPSQIPVHKYNHSNPPYPRPASSASSSNGNSSLMQRALSPASSSARSPRHSRVISSGSAGSHSMIPVPKLNLTPGSRPGSSLSVGTNSGPDVTPARPTLMSGGGVHVSGSSSRFRGVPSSFRGDGSPSVHPPALPNFGTGGSMSRPSSRTSSRRGLGGGVTPGLMEHSQMPAYVPNKSDELDVEVANVVNGFPHGLTFERVDPIRKGTVAKASAPGSGEEVRGQYAISNLLSRKVVTCRLVLVQRGEDAGGRKVMVRVGGGWLDLQMYILNRQAGLS